MNTMTFHFHGHWYAIEGIAIACALILFIGVTLTPSAEYEGAAISSGNSTQTQEQTRRGTRSYSATEVGDSASLVAGSSADLEKRRERAESTFAPVNNTPEFDGRRGREY